MANSSSDLTSFIPEHELVELLWDNGQIVMQGRSNRTKKSSGGTELFYSGRAEEKGCRDDLNMVKFGQTGAVQTAAARDLLPSVPCVMNPHEDDTAQWMNYPIDEDSLQNVYCSEFFTEMTGVMSSLANTTSNSNPADRSAGYGQLTKDSHGFRSPSESSEPSKSRLNHLFGMPQQYQILSENSKSREVDQDNGVQKPLPKSSNGLVNFSHFSRPAALVKANLHAIDRLHEKPCTAARTFTAESTLVDSGSNGRPRVDDAARVRNSVVVNRSSSSLCQNSSMAASVNKEKNEAERAPEPVVASSVCSGHSAGAASNDRKQKSRKRTREGEESGEQSEDLEDESAAVKELSSGRGSSGKRSRAAEVHNLSERRRRDRINEKMKALQELIPNCNKVDKASMLDEAIEYLKTLQLQVQMMSMGSGFCMAPMRLPAGMNMQHMRAPQMSPFSPLGVGMGIGMGMGLGFGMGMIDLNGSPGLIPVPPMPGTQYPCPSVPGLPGLYRIPHSSSIHSLGIPAQSLPVSVPHSPSFNSQTGFSPQKTSLNPWQVSERTPSTSNNQQHQCINVEPNGESSQAVCHNDSPDLHGSINIIVKPVVDISSTNENRNV